VCARYRPIARNVGAGSRADAMCHGGHDPWRARARNREHLARQRFLRPGTEARDGESAPRRQGPSAGGSATRRALARGTRAARPYGAQNVMAGHGPVFGVPTYTIHRFVGRRAMVAA